MNSPLMPPPPPVVSEPPSLHQQLMAVPSNVLVEKYRALRDAVGDIKDRHSQELKPYHEMMNAMESAALARMQAEGIDSIKTKSGTMYQSTVRSFKVADPEAFKIWVKTHDRIDMMECRAANSVVDEFVEETNGLPAGLEAASRTTVNFRK